MRFSSLSAIALGAGAAFAKELPKNEVLGAGMLIGSSNISRLITMLIG